MPSAFSAVGTSSKSPTRGTPRTPSVSTWRPELLTDTDTAPERLSYVQKERFKAVKGRCQGAIGRGGQAQRQAPEHSHPRAGGDGRRGGSRPEGASLPAR